MKLRRLISNSTKESRGLPACRHCMVIIALIVPPKFWKQLTKDWRAMWIR
jgi:hypothetical protein